MHKTLPLILLFAVLPATAQDHACVDLNGNKTHATVACNTMGMLDADEKDDHTLAAIQCPGLKDVIAQLEASILRQDKLMQTPYSEVKRKVLSQQLNAKRQRYQRKCMQ